jgi:hypothetical protein
MSIIIGKIIPQLGIPYPRRNSDSHSFIIKIILSIYYTGTFGRKAGYHNCLLLSILITQDFSIGFVDGVDQGKEIYNGDESRWKIWGK